MSQIAVFDIGKTNKKLFIFDEDYRIVYEKNEHLQEAQDEDGFPCEDIESLTDWVLRSIDEVLKDIKFNIKAINVSAYGASFVHFGKDDELVAPLYNYLKPFPEDLKKQFYATYGSEEKLALETASPALGNLNSGLQLYWLKHRNPLIFNKIKWSLHLPQYITYVIGRKLGWFRSPEEVGSDNTSIGCHTMLWDFQKNDYHHWAKAEGITEKFPPIASPAKGLHDSSAALLPYLLSYKTPFVLISSGTWSIFMNPFNDMPLTADELAQDCLCYLTHEGKPVKSSRLFAGYELEVAVSQFGLRGVHISSFNDLENLGEPGKMYLVFLKQLVDKQLVALKLVLTGETQQIFVDGGFSKNEIFMTLLAEALPGLEVYAAEVAQASALGAAVAIHEQWNNQPLPKKLIKCQKYN
jgi:sugar (pentulose or hexulose) kinase